MPKNKHIRLDPTRTTMLRKAFVSDMRRRFKALNKAIHELVVEDDAFGLAKGGEFVIQQQVARQAWRFRTDAKKVQAYQAWLQQQINAGVLTPVGGVAGKPWTATYIESAYKKGAVRAYTDANAAKLATTPIDSYLGGRSQFLNEAFAAPEALSKMELLSTRAFEELKGVTAAMSQQMSRGLSQGLAHGWGASKISRELRNTVTNLTKQRAEVIARTEVIAAHAEGQLDAFERLGAAEVGIMAEWSTAGDERVCDLCDMLEAVVLKIGEARGLLPRHPNCRCTFIPASNVRKEPQQKRGAEKKQQIAKSIRAERPNASFKVARAKTRWYGKSKVPAGMKVPKPVSKAPVTEGRAKLTPANLDTKEKKDVFDRWFSDSEECHKIRDAEKMNFLVADANAKRAKIFNDVLDEGKPYKGYVYRGGTYSDYPELGKIKEGAEWFQQGSVCTSTSLDVAKEFVQEAHNAFWDDLYLLKVKSKTAVPVDGIATDVFKYQKEAVMRMGTRYKIKSVKNYTAGNYIESIDKPVKVIEMLEI